MSAEGLAVAHIPLPPQSQLRITHLQAEIAVLRQARDCVTDAATPDVIYGRVDDLINQRQSEILDLVRKAGEAHEAAHG
jgi:hypothetical protein